MRIGPEPTTDTFHVVDYAGGVCWQQLELRKNQHLVAPFVKSFEFPLFIDRTKNRLFLPFSEEDGHIPGNVLAVDTKKPYTHLQDYGGTFLSR